MKLCTLCGYRFESPVWQCPACHTSPPLLNGFLAFAPDLAEENAGYDPSYFGELASLEAKSFWFQARNRLILWALGEYFTHVSSFLEIGCGTGFVLLGVENTFPEMKLFGSEIYSEGLGYAADRLEKCTLLQMDARHIPFEKEFGVVGAFDVLEHVEEDVLVLRQIYQALTTGGGIILTVPQHPFLWSRTDEHARHVRRYTSKDLVTKVENAGFELLRKTSFMALLLPLMLISRLTKRFSDDDFDPLSELRVGGLVNSILKKVLDIEFAFIRKGISFPLGGSLLLIARKR